MNELTGTYSAGDQDNVGGRGLVVGVLGDHHRALGTSYWPHPETDQGHPEAVREGTEQFQRPEDIEQFEPVEEDHGYVTRRLLGFRHGKIVAPR